MRSSINVHLFTFDAAVEIERLLAHCRMQDYMNKQKHTAQSNIQYSIYIIWDTRNTKHDICFTFALSCVWVCVFVSPVIVFWSFVWRCASRVLCACRTKCIIVSNFKEYKKFRTRKRGVKTEKSKLYKKYIHIYKIYDSFDALTPTCRQSACNQQINWLTISCL